MMDLWDPNLEEGFCPKCEYEAVMQAAKDWMRAVEEEFGNKEHTCKEDDNE